MTSGDVKCLGHGMACASSTEVHDYFSHSNLQQRVYKIEINSRGDPLRSPRNTLYPEKLALTSPTDSGCLVGIVQLRTKATEFSCFFLTYNSRNQ
jgi:hypothetical protein